jgi:hypothetical protein
MAMTAGVAENDDGTGSPTDFNDAGICHRQKVTIRQQRQLANPRSREANFLEASRGRRGNRLDTSP